MRLALALNLLLANVAVTGQLVFTDQTSRSASIPCGEFKTEPEFICERFNISQIPENRTVLAIGYIFIDPMVRTEGWGPQIYDIEGNLIWHGDDTFRTQNLHICDYAGTTGTHLCYSHRGISEKFPDALPETHVKKRPNVNYGHNVVLDSSYKTVMNHSKAFDDLPFNPHAFEMAKHGYTYTTLVRRTRTFDLSPYGGQKHGWVKGECMQEVDVRNGDDLFHWCYLDSRLEIWQSKIFFSSSDQDTNTTSKKVGKGTKHEPWDFLHMNGVSKTSAGDYLIGIRHADLVIKIAGRENDQAEPGSILWQLGGKTSDFTLNDFHSREGFTRLHDVRSVSVNDTHEVISLFNNAWEGSLEPSQDFSEAQIISLDLVNHEAWLQRSYPHPMRQLAHGRGSVQLLPNGNVLVGWGALPEISEFDANGTLLYHTSFVQPSKENSEFSYRAFKFPWTGKPEQRPRIFAYCRSCNAGDGSAPLVAYVSWNGATDVIAWRFYTSSQQRGPWNLIGTFKKEGFETLAHLTDRSDRSNFARYVFVEALDVEGKVLGHAMAETFVPRRKHEDACNRLACKLGFRYDPENSKALHCGKGQNSDAFAISVLGLLIIFIEVLTLTLQHTLYMLAESQLSSKDSLVSNDGETIERSNPLYLLWHSGITLLSHLHRRTENKNEILLHPDPA